MAPLKVNVVFGGTAGDWSSGMIFCELGSKVVAIRAIVTDTDAGLRGPKLLWPADAWDGWHGTSPMKNLYVGSAGVLWALDRLRTRGHAETRLDLADLATRNLELFRTRPDFMKDIAKFTADTVDPLAPRVTAKMVLRIRSTPPPDSGRTRSAARAPSWPSGPSTTMSTRRDPPLGR